MPHLLAASRAVILFKGGRIPADGTFAFPRISEARNVCRVFDLFMNPVGNNIPECVHDRLSFFYTNSLAGDLIHILSLLFAGPAGYPA